MNQPHWRRVCVTWFGASVVLIVVAATVGACDGPPGGPDKPTNLDSQYTAAIVGPASVPPGQSAAYTVALRRANGSAAPIGSVAWSSNKPLLLRVDQAGMATAAMLHGDAILQAQVTPAGQSGAVRGSREVLVLADGTHRLVGKVTEAGTSGLALHGARLEARSSDDLSAPIVTYATTTPDGQYWLYGVPREAFVHIWLDGYRSTTTRVQLNAHETRHFNLELETPRPVFAGTYTMTVEAGGSCYRSGLPDSAKHRQYAATVTQDGPQLSVVLTEASFASLGGRVASRFSGRATASGVQLELAYFYSGGFYYGASTPDVAELLPNGTLLVTSGRGLLSGTRDHLSGVLGNMDLYNGGLSDGAFIGGCSSPRVTWTRR